MFLYSFVQNPQYEVFNIKIFGVLYVFYISLSNIVEFNDQKQKKTKRLREAAKKRSFLVARPLRFYPFPSRA